MIVVPWIKGSAPCRPTDQGLIIRDDQVQSAAAALALTKITNASFEGEVQRKWRICHKRAAKLAFSTKWLSSRMAKPAAC
jgi:hypothetical protein